MLSEPNYVISHLCIILEALTYVGHIENMAMHLSIRKRFPCLHSVI